MKEQFEKTMKQIFGPDFKTWPTEAQWIATHAEALYVQRDAMADLLKRYATTDRETLESNEFVSDFELKARRLLTEAGIVL